MREPSQLSWLDTPGNLPSTVEILRTLCIKSQRQTGSTRQASHRRILAPSLTDITSASPAPLKKFHFGLLRPPPFPVSTCGLHNSGGNCIFFITIRTLFLAKLLFSLVGKQQHVGIKLKKFTFHCECCRGATFKSAVGRTEQHVLKNRGYDK